MSKRISINTDTAPSAIGAYSQAIKSCGLIFISGQIPLDPKTMKVIDGDIDLKIQQVLNNIKNIALAAGADINNTIKINVYLTDLKYFANVNQAMESFFIKPYPARAAVEVSRLPKDVEIEMDAILHADD